jgi:hypothetical protein
MARLLDLDGCEHVQVLLLGSGNLGSLVDSHCLPSTCAA